MSWVGFIALFACVADPWHRFQLEESLMRVWRSTEAFPLGRKCSVCKYTDANACRCITNLWSDSLLWWRWQISVLDWAIEFPSKFWEMCCFTCDQLFFNTKQNVPKRKKTYLANASIAPLVALSVLRCISKYSNTWNWACVARSFLVYILWV